MRGVNRIEIKMRKRTKNRLYGVWANMKQRCNSPNHMAYKWCGGRGVKVCEQWNAKHGFPAFLEWAQSNGYSDSLTIDRINNDGNYEPSNCRWVSLGDNLKNRRKRTDFSKYRGLSTQRRDSWDWEKQDIELSEIHGLTRERIRQIRKALGMPQSPAFKFHRRAQRIEKTRLDFILRKGQ